MKKKTTGAPRFSKAALKKSECRYNNFIRHFSGIAYQFDLTSRTPLFLQGALEKISGYCQDDFLEGRVSWLNLIYEKDRERVFSIRNDLESGRSLKAEYEYRITAKNGEVRWVRDICHRLTGLQDNSLLIQGEVYNITDQKAAREAVMETEKNYRSIFNNANDMIILHDGDTMRILDVNRKVPYTFGWNKAEFLKFGIGYFNRGTPPYSEKEARAYFLKAREGRPQLFQWHCKRKDGSLFWVEANLKTAPINNKRCILAIVRDITERKKNREKLEKSLKEKEALLREVHHRTKNNMQVISSLLSLQSAEIKDSKMLELFRESQRRIRSMALVHEQLYKAEDITRITVGPYVETLIREVFRAFGVEEGGIRLKIEISPLSLDINRAVPLGLVINELVSNALQHAFTKLKKGSISVQIRHDKKEIEAKINDNGRGMSTGVNFKSPNTLGLKLVKTLVRDQLEGRIGLRRSGGTRYALRFPAKKG